MPDDMDKLLDNERVPEDLEGSVGPPEWTSDQLMQWYRRVLQAPIEETSRGVKTSREEVEKLAVEAYPPIRTFIDLIRHEYPPLALIKTAKTFAKADYFKHHRLPPPVSLTLYFLMIVVAKLRYSQRISSQSNQQLKAAYAERVREPWLDDGTRRVFQLGLSDLQDVEEYEGDIDASGGYEAIIDDDDGDRQS